MPLNPLQGFTSISLSVINKVGLARQHPEPRTTERASPEPQAADNRAESAREEAELSAERTPAEEPRTEGTRGRQVDTEA
ncbi:MAG: hypothetical protein GF333_03455 [Candidatus Omnitrophica bacterium]|nr:hypothetical protein [Candidatus Omnitrophota bacterium]